MKSGYRFSGALLGLLLALGGARAETQSNVPPKFNIPWSNSAAAQYVRTIPQASQIGIQNCAASLETGFPPLTFVPQSAGGCPPFGQDFNGIFKQLSQWGRWGGVGGVVIYDSAFSTAIGGYPKGAMLSVVASPGCHWLSLVDNNASNPDTGGANWFNTCNQAVGGDLVGTMPNPTLAASGVTAATYTRPKVTFDAKGRATAASSGSQPTYQRFTATGACTYVPPAGVIRTRIRMAGGGGAEGVNGNGGTTTFGSWTAVGGSQAGTGGSGGVGGTGGSTGTGTLVERQTGGNGTAGPFFSNNGNGSLTLNAAGGLNRLGGGPNSGQGATNNQNLAYNNSGVQFSGGGGAGEFVEFDVINPTTTSCSVGARGGSFAQHGVILAEEHYD